MEKLLKYICYALVILFVLSAVAFGLNKSGVVVLWDDENVENMSNKNVLLLYYGPNCGFSINFLPVWDKLCQKLDLIGVGHKKINCDEMSGVCNRDGINGVPTIRLLTEGGKVIHYEGPRKIDDIINFVKNSN